MSQQLPYTPGVVVRYKGTTETRGSRVILALTGRDLPTKTIIYDYAESNICDMAANALKKAGFIIKGYTDHDVGYTVLIDWVPAGPDFSLKAMWAKVGK